MSAPVLAYNGTTVTLPYPVADGRNSRDVEEISVTRRTLSGVLRTTVLSHHYVYSLTFRDVPIATYDALVALWYAAIAGNDYPVFSFPTLWSSAASVEVALGIGASEPAESGGGNIDFALTLTEVNPR